MREQFPLPHEPSVDKDSNPEKRIGDDGIIRKLARHKNFKFVPLLAGLLIGAEQPIQKASAHEGLDNSTQSEEQTQEWMKEAIDHASYDILRIDDFVRKQPDYIDEVADREDEKRFVKTWRNGVILSGDNYIIVKFVERYKDLETNNDKIETSYWVDRSKDGSVNRIIVVPGAVNVTHDQQIYKEALIDDSDLSRYLNNRFMDDSDAIPEEEIVKDKYGIREKTPYEKRDFHNLNFDGQTVDNLNMDGSSFDLYAGSPKAPDLPNHPYYYQIYFTNVVAEVAADLNEGDISK